MGVDWARRFMQRLGMTPRARTTTRLVTNDAIEEAASGLFPALHALQSRYHIPAV
jgi:hypothetical protein